MIQTSQAQGLSDDDDDENIPNSSPINLLRTEHVITCVLKQVGKKTLYSTYHHMSDQEKKNFNVVTLDYLSWYYTRPQIPDNPIAI